MVDAEVQDRDDDVGRADRDGPGFRSADVRAGSCADLAADLLAEVVQPPLLSQQWVVREEEVGRSFLPSRGRPGSRFPRERRTSRSRGGAGREHGAEQPASGTARQHGANPPTASLPPTGAHVSHVGRLARGSGRKAATKCLPGGPRLSHGRAVSHGPGEGDAASQRNRWLVQVGAPVAVHRHDRKR